MGRGARWIVIGATLVLAGAWHAQAAIQWRASSSLSVSVATPPVQWELGAGANKTHYFSPGITLSSNGTQMSGTLSAKAGADARVKDVVRVAARAVTTQHVVLSATQVTSAHVETFTWSVYNGTTLVGTLDMRAASPSVALDVPSGETWKLDLRLDMADGAGNDNSPASFDVRMVVS